MKTFKIKTVKDVEFIVFANDIKECLRVFEKFQSLNPNYEVRQSFNIKLVEELERYFFVVSKDVIKDIERRTY